jgi:hypothetical protein
MTESGDREPDKGFGTHTSELVGLIVAYAKQETVVPLKSLGRYVAWGVAGALLLTAGMVLAAVAALRAIQSETGRHLAGNLTWVPYTGAALLALAGLVWAVARISRGDRAVGR